jgi:ankyrin repeat protein
MDFFEAARTGDSAKVRALLAKKAKVDAPFPGFVMLGDGYMSIRSGTALMLASAEGHVQVAEVLLDAGADANAREASDWTPLFLAAIFGHASMIRLLAARGADLTAVTRQGDTALHLATSQFRRKTEAALALLESGAEVNVQRKNNLQTPLHDVADWPIAESGVAEETVTLARRLLDAGADIASRDQIRRTPLHLAADWGNVPLARLLVGRGADVNALDHEDSTPLHEAYDHPAVAQFLLKHGVKPDRQTKSLRLTALHQAVQGKQREVIQLIARYGGKLDLRDKEGQSPLALAASEADVETYELLLRLGAKDSKGSISREMAAKRLRLAAAAGDVSRVRELLRQKPDVNAGSWDDDNAPPLIGAATGGHLAVVRLLLAARARVDLPWRYGTTPLFVAADNGHGAVVRALIDAGANVNVAADGGMDGKKGSTPLLAAAESGTADGVRALLDAGALLNVRAKDQTTPLLAAALGGHAAASQILLDAGAERNWLADQCLEKLRLPAARNQRAFRDAVRELERRTKVKAKRHAEFPEGVTFDLKGDEPRMHAILDEAQTGLLEHGLSLVYAEMLHGDQLALLPTANKFAVVASLGPWPDGAPAMLNWLRKLEADYPFTVHGASYATLMLRFTGKVADPADLARRCFRLGSDERGVIVNGEHALTETQKGLAAALSRRRPIVRLWWD